MAKKNSFGKFIAFTTAVAAIGGACYIFRDQIKESEIYKKATDKLSDLRNKMSDKFANEEDDFFFDDEFEDEFEDDVFSDDAKKNREYTSITINAKDEDSNDEAETDIADNVAEDITDITEDTTDAIQDIADNVTESTEAATEEVSDAAKEVADDIANAVKNKTEDVKEIFADVAIPTITFGNNNNEQAETSATEEVLGYEYEGLSDVAEDPDVLADMDKLDF